MPHINPGELCYWWNVASGDFSCLLRGERVTYILSGGNPPWFQQVDPVGYRLLVEIRSIRC